MREHGVSRGGTYCGGQLFSGGPPDPRHAAERRQQRPTPAGPDAGDVVELGPEVPHPPGLPVRIDWPELERKYSNAVRGAAK